MSSIDTKAKFPQDIVAIFHASFHPTKGHVIDWFLKASNDLSLHNLEFSALPSGLHLVEQDVIYFTKDFHRGVCVYRRRQTTEAGQRGYRLSSLGILLAKSDRPRPWKHVPALKELITHIYSKLENNDVLEPTESDWEPAKDFFNERKVRRADLGGAGDWNGWSAELSGQPETGTQNTNPILHLSHLLRILGPSSLTLYKHVLGRRRILIYTLPPVEAACILCQVAADICYDEQSDYVPTASVAESSETGSQCFPKLKRKSKGGINVLGMVTLNDLDRMKEESKTGHGWVACTTDAIFLEKPAYYDLVIDLTTSTPNKATRPTFYASRPLLQPNGAKGSSHKLSVIRFAWSDVKLWNELDRILQLDSGDCEHNCCGVSGDVDAKSKFISTWTDAWRVYEDVCIICAGLWMGTWRSNSTMSYSTTNGSMANWGSIKLEGDDDLTVGGSYMRNVGMGIEGRPSMTGSGGIVHNQLPSSSSSKSKRSSGLSWPSGRATSLGKNIGGHHASSSSAFSSSSTPFDESVRDPAERRDRQVLTTLTLLRTFHANTCFQLSQLETIISRHVDVGLGVGSTIERTIYLTPKDVLSFELGPLSSFDARYLGWIAEEYADGTRVVVKRSWRDLLGIIFGYG